MLPDNFLWNQVEKIEHDNPIRAAFLTLLTIKNDSSITVLGTAFIIKALGDHSIALTAAHCLEEIRNLNEKFQSHPSALSEFLPPQKKLNLSKTKVFYVKNGIGYVCEIEFAVWQTENDHAVLKVLSPSATNLFEHEFMLENNAPSDEEIIAMIGYGDVKIHHKRVENNEVMTEIQNRLVMRIGKIEGKPECPLLKAPSIQTTIPVYSSMSGGIVARFSQNQLVKPFAMICHSMNMTSDASPLNDRSKSGKSVAVLLNAKIEYLQNASQLVQFEFENSKIGSTILN